MSWSVSGECSLPEELKSLKEQALAQNTECSDQFDAALAAVEHIIDSDSVGTTEKRFAVSMAGHSNPNHAPRAGYPNDCITVSVFQK